MARPAPDQVGQRYRSYQVKIAPIARYVIVLSGRILAKQRATARSGTYETTVYIGGILEKVSRGSVTEYRHLIAGGKEVAAIYTRPTSGSPATYYVHTDHLGSPELITDASGVQVVKLSFGAYGERRGSSWTGTPSSGDWTAIGNTTREGFTGHEMLDNLNLIHMNGRVYDPVAGRFLSADPIAVLGSGQGANSYAYVMNNPLNAIDPSGFSPTPPRSLDDTLPCMDGPQWLCDANSGTLPWGGPASPIGGMVWGAGEGPTLLDGITVTGERDVGSVVNNRSSHGQPFDFGQYARLVDFLQQQQFAGPVFLGGPGQFALMPVFQLEDIVVTSQRETARVVYNRPPPRTVPVSGDTLRALLCFANACAEGSQLLVTGGAESAFHTPGSLHYQGLAVDIPPPPYNDLIDPAAILQCAAGCGFTHGHFESFPEDPTRDHWHFQIGPGLSVPALPGAIRRH